jgi:hypothetical protein
MKVPCLFSSSAGHGRIAWSVISHGRPNSKSADRRISRLLATKDR